MPETNPPVGAPDPNAPAPATTTGLTPNVAAGLACLLPLVGGIIFLALEKKDKFVRFWAMQSVFLGGILFGVTIVLGIASFIFGMIPLIGFVLVAVLLFAKFAFGVAWFVVYVIAIFKAFTGQEWEVPWLGPLARKQLAQMDASAMPPSETPPPPATP